MKVRFVWWAAEKNNIYINTYIINSRKHLAIIRRFPFSWFIKQSWLAYGRDHRFCDTTRPKAAKERMKKRPSFKPLSCITQIGGVVSDPVHVDTYPQMMKQSDGQKASRTVDMMDGTAWDTCFCGTGEWAGQRYHRICML